MKNEILYKLVYAPIAELMEMAKPLLKLDDFRQLVTQLEDLNESQRDFLLASCDASGNRIESFTSMARRLGRSTTAIRTRFTSAMNRVRRALCGIIYYSEGSWATLPDAYLKLVYPNRYAAKLTQTGVLQMKVNNLEEEISCLKAKLKELRKVRDEINEDLEKLERTGRNPPLRMLDLKLASNDEHGREDTR